MHHLFFAAASVCDTGQTFIFLPHWWEYLKVDPKADALGQCQFNFTFPTDLLAVGLAVIDILLRLAGFIAVIAIIISGISHLFTGGNPEKAAAARKRLINALLGLAIAMIATAIVTFIGNQLA